MTGEAPGVATLRLPSVLADVVGGARTLTVAPAEPTVAGLLDALADGYPVLVRRIRDEAGALRPYVNVYVDGEDVRHLGGVSAPVPQGAVVHVLPSIAGG